MSGLRPMPLPAGGGNIATNVTGGLHSAVPGRTDHLPISVPDGAYVIPADIVSALGQGNTQSGMRVLNHMFGTHSIGSAMAKGRAPTVDIAAAGGEYVVPPDAVARLGHGNLKQGHTTLDAFVRRTRSRTITHLKKLPGPAKSGT